MADVIYQPLGNLGRREYYTAVANDRPVFSPEGLPEIYERIPSIREAIRAAPGWKILSADYSQIEVKIMAFLSQDPWLIGAINAKDENGKGKDIHSYLCCEINGYEYAFFVDVLKKKFKHPECVKYNLQQLIDLHHRYSEDRSGTKAVTLTHSVKRSEMAVQ